MSTPTITIHDFSVPGPTERAPRMSHDEWRARMTVLAYVSGKELQDVGFRCPRCGHVATMRDFKAANADPARAPHECIGRIVGAQGGFYLPNGKPNPTPTAQPCDWTAHGLLGTLDSGVIVVLPDGREVRAFSFAEPTPEQQEAFARFEAALAADRAMMGGEQS